MLWEKVQQFGPNVQASPTNTYISLLRREKKFAIVQVTARRLDIGVKLKDQPSQGRLEASGAWNAMVTHRVQIENPQQIDAEVLAWLRQAYDQS